MAAQSTSYGIIGRGIAGSSVAYHLSEITDDQITLFERTTPASETTRKSMSILSCQGDDIIHGMKGYALQLYNEFLANRQSESEFHLVGSLGVTTTDEGAKDFKRSAEGAISGVRDTFLMDTQNTVTQYMRGGEIHQSMIVPHLNTEEITAAIYRPNKGYAISDELALEFIERAKDNGVDIKTDTEITDIEIEDNQVTAIKSNSKRYDVDQVVSAAGPWNIQMAAKVGLDIPVKHTLGPILKLKPPEGLSHIVPHTKHYESRIYFVGYHDGTVFVGHNPNDQTAFEEASVYSPEDMDEKMPAEIRSQAMEIIEQMYPCLSDAEVVDEWVGIRSLTPDDLPIAGWTSVEGFALAVAPGGMNLAPAIGRMVAEQLVNGNPTGYYESLSITRFDGFTDTHQ